VNRRGGPRPNLLNGNIWSAVASGELRPQRTKVSLLTGPSTTTWNAPVRVWRLSPLSNPVVPDHGGYPPTETFQVRGWSEEPTLEGFVAEVYQRLDETNKRLVENNNRLLRLERELGIAEFTPYRKEST
jgi:hypothetical protein